MKKILIALAALLILAGIPVCAHFRSGRVIAISPDGTPLEGAKVWISYVSAPAVLQGLTDAKGRFDIPAKTARRGGWHSIIVSWEDPKGIEYLGQNFDDKPGFPLSIRLHRR